MWVIGGSLNDGGHFGNDVWNSDDGKKWNLVLDSAPFLPRCTHASLVYQNKMWVIGGYVDGAYPKHDVWSSADGKTWELVTAAAAFTERTEVNAINWKNAMWVIDGQVVPGGGGAFHDVWRPLMEKPGTSGRTAFHGAIGRDYKLLPPPKTPYSQSGDKALVSTNI